MSTFDNEEFKCIPLETWADMFKTMSSDNQRLVVQNIVSLMSSLRGQLVKCFTTLKPNTLIFFVEKMREAFALQSFSHFSTKNIEFCQISTFEILTKH